MKPGIYNLSNAEYHVSEGISKSHLDQVARSPATYIWSKTAPRIESKTLDLGSLVHTLLLEPHMFELEYAITPEGLDRRTNEGKAAFQKFAVESAGKKIISKEDFDKAIQMMQSALAHPSVARIFANTDTAREESIYWQDEETGLLCRCRPDLRFKNRPVIVDVKTTADIYRFDRSIGEYRYHVQDGWYSSGCSQQVYNGESVKFMFLAISSTLDCGRYPVRLIELDQEDRNRGLDIARRDLMTIAECQQKNVWPGVETVRIPEWSLKNE